LPHAAGKSAEALLLFERCRDCYARVVAADPKQLLYQQRLAEAYIKLGSLHGDANRLDQARTFFQKSLNRFSSS